jgi:hypothetical protein
MTWERIKKYKCMSSIPRDSELIGFFVVVSFPFVDVVSYVQLS